MKIYDCFIYFDEELLLDIRLNVLNKFVDKFVIIENIFSHSGELKNLILILKISKNLKVKLNIF